MNLVGINVGSYVHGCELPGWENVDKAINARFQKIPGLRPLLGAIGLLPGYQDRWPKNLRVHDVRKGLPYQDNSLLYIHSSHCFEHLYQDEGRRFLRECFRVLKPGGIIRLAVPDLEILIRAYLQASPTDGQNGNEKLAADNFVRDLMMMWDTAPRGLINRWIKPLLGKHTTHCWVYDWHSLRERLRQAGFTDVTRRAYLQSAIPEVKFLDVPDKEPESLYIEGTKPVVGA